MGKIMYLSTNNKFWCLLAFFWEQKTVALHFESSTQKKKKKSCYIGKNHKLSEEIENGLKFCPKMSVGI